MTFGSTLARIRRKRGWSQEALALRAGLSQRHVSFLETGRSRPGQNSLRKLTDALTLRGWEHRALLEALAPSTRITDACQPDPTLVFDLMKRFCPWPAYAFHPDGTMVTTNAALDALLARAAPGEDLWRTTAPPTGPNIYDLLFHPRGLVRWLANPELVVPETLRRLQIEAAQDAGLSPTLKRAQAYTAATRWSATEDLPPPVLVERYLIEDRTLSVVSVVSHLSSPGELELSLLRIESFVPADVESEKLLQGL